MSKPTKENSEVDITAKLRCSFCKKGATDVGTLIAGPEASICDACVLICVDAIFSRAARPNETS